MMKQE